MCAIFRGVFALIAILGLSVLVGFLIMMLLMLASMIREMIQNWRDARHVQSQDR